nr:peptidase [Rhodococcus opacus]
MLRLNTHEAAAMSTLVTLTSLDNREPALPACERIGVDEMRQIVELILDGTRRLLKAQDIGLDVTTAAEDYLAAEGTNPSSVPGRCGAPSRSSSTLSCRACS